jgi:hypothetical protein
MDLGFKFQIGQVVRHVGCEPATDKLWTLTKQVRMLVVARLYEENTAGSERIYFCRGVWNTGAVSEDLLKLLEVELVASEPFPADRFGKD